MKATGLNSGCRELVGVMRFGLISHININTFPNILQLKYVILNGASRSSGGRMSRVGRGHRSPSFRRYGSRRIRTQVSATRATVLSCDFAMISRTSSHQGTGG